MGQDSSKCEGLSKEDRNYLMKNTVYTKDKIMEYYRGFMEMNPDGYMTLDKFKQLLSEVIPSEAMIEHMFRAADKSASGNLSFRELLMHMNLEYVTDPKEKLDYVFQLFDMNRNGTLEKEEIKEMFRLMYSMAGADAPAEEAAEQTTSTIFVICDKNKDGILTKEEFISGALREPRLMLLLGRYA